MHYGLSISQLMSEIDQTFNRSIDIKQQEHISNIEFKSYDFSTLYTTLPHIQLKARLRWLVTRIFKLAKSSKNDHLIY